MSMQNDNCINLCAAVAEQWIKMLKHLVWCSSIIQEENQLGELWEWGGAMDEHGNEKWGHAKEQNPCFERNILRVNILLPVQKHLKKRKSKERERQR